jgi:hypothetical protein
MPIYCPSLNVELPLEVPKVTLGPDSGRDKITAMSSRSLKPLSRALVRAAIFLTPAIILSLMLWRPVLIAQSSVQTPRTVSESFVRKVGELELAHLRGEKAEVHFSAEEINSALDQPAQLAFVGDRITGQLASEIQGQTVYLTVRGTLGVAEGYLTFQPDEVRVGNMPVPVSLLAGVLQKKLQEPGNREKLKLPDYIAGLRIEDGQLVIQTR